MNFKQIIILAACFLTMNSCFLTVTHEVSPTTVEVKNGEITKVSGERKISGIYPHLTTYAHGRIDGSYGFGSECGIGALAEWNNKLYMINYAAHQPKGSEHKLYIIDQNLNMEIFEGSIGGTPTARMVHQESNQLFLGPYVISKEGNIRVIPYSRMEGRLNAYARHLKDPENMVYMYDMEGMLYEVNVNDLTVNKLFHDPLPGWHGKGAYTSQGKLVVSNNGEHANEGRRTSDQDNWDSDDYEWVNSWKVEKNGIFGRDKLGILAEFDGEEFKVIERKQFTDITTKNGVYAVPNDDSPLWAIGWDEKSVRLKVMDQGKWYTYLLPKATYNNDPPHGWFTEWPRIRSIGEDRMLMDMHGMFYDFPASFSSSNTAGIEPIGSHLRYIPDFIQWNGQLVIATDETSIQGNPYAGQPQSNLWLGKYEDLKEWGPASGYGAIWLEDEVEANSISDPFLISGFTHKMIYLVNHGDEKVKIDIEIDSTGNNDFQNSESVMIPAGSTVPFLMDSDINGEWLRLRSDRMSKISASLHLTNNFTQEREDETLFEGLAEIDYEGKVNYSKLYSNKTNFNLSIFSGDVKNETFHVTHEHEFTKFDFTFDPGINDTTASYTLRVKDIWYEDEASIVLRTSDEQLRLPKTNELFSQKLPSTVARVVREVESERELANIAGTFYELPLWKVGQEPFYHMLRPVATHNKQIFDFNTWNGLLVLSGVKVNAPESDHIYKSDDGKTGLWFGGIDDLWKLGKPKGMGGPWKDTAIKAGEPSDKFLMTGYDQKSMTLSADQNTEVTLMLYVNHYLDQPVKYKTFKLNAGEEITYSFPKGFSAHWAQLVSSEDCNATAWFEYD
ncbi:hypothetical protein [Portibacter marinus]|uniref:hypothetical protein n=1 Tax=Portibacter marinus TaxID=2898660 RepID=UPI001F1691A6|nr:hypothetical protein [Portibacter marinus]